MYLLKAAFTAGYPLTVVGAVLFSAFSAFFYLRVIRLMSMSEADDPVKLTCSPGIRAVLGLCLAGTLGLGLLPGSFLGWIVAALAGG